MAEMKKVPAIRFNKFADDWVESELDSLFSKIKNAFVGTATPYYVNEGHFYLESNNVKNGHINRNNEVFINDYFYKKQQDNLLHAGDIVMVQSGHVGHSAVIPPELNNTAAHALIIFADKKRELCSYFLNYQFQTDISKQEIASFTTGNTIKHILSSDMKKFKVLLPEVTEQTQIGSYFQHLDKLISLHQAKVSKLTNLKKAMLEKMFPKQGADISEIRFKGFAGAWGMSKLSDITSLITKGTTPLIKAGNKTVNFIKIENIDSQSGEIFVTSKITLDEHEKYLKRSQLQENDILFSIAGTLGRVALVNKSLLPANTNQALAIIRLNKNSISFILTFLRSKALDEFVKKNPTVGAQPNMSLTQIASIDIPLPTIEEQEKIGTYFQNLDKLITLHQTELEKLKNFKSACLEKMFV